MRQISPNDPAGPSGLGVTVLDVINTIVAAASRDAGTAVLDRGAWRVQARQALRAAPRGPCTGLLLVDLDKFKLINDRVGHPAGDVALSAVVDAIRSEVRQVDIVGRLGGDEFAILLTDAADSSSVVAVGERIRARVAGLRLEVQSPDGVVALGPVSVSVRGTAVIAGPAVEVCDGHAELTSPLWHADAALRRAKRSGGDAVRMLSYPVTGRGERGPAPERSSATAGRADAVTPGSRRGRLRRWGERRGWWPR